MTPRHPLAIHSADGCPFIMHDRPSPARIVDFLCGGAHNFAADRAVGAAILRAVPNLRAALHAEWTFRRHLVLRAVGDGVSEVLELGAGMAAPGTVLGVDRRHVPATVRVVVTDADPVAAEQQRLRHAGHRNVTVVHADPRHPGHLLEQATRTLALRTPTLVLCLSVLHHLPDPAARNLLEAMASRLPAGSRLAVSHLVLDGWSADLAATLTRLYAGTSQPLHLRTRRQFRALLHTAGLTRIASPHCRCHRGRGRGRGIVALAASVIPGHAGAVLGKDGPG